MVLAAAAVMQADGQTTAGDMLVNAPAELLPMLPRNTRLDMIDYFKSSLPNASANLLQGKSRITALSADNVEVDVSGASYGKRYCGGIYRDLSYTGSRQ